MGGDASFTSEFTTRAEAFAERVGARQTRRNAPYEWRARCPAHNGTSDTSLKITAGDTPGGPALVRCQGGCATEDVLAKVGASWADLFPPNGRQPNKGARVSVGGKTASQAKAPFTWSRREFFGPVTATYAYHDLGGTEVGRVTRHQTPTGKTVRPWHPDEHGEWILGAGDATWPPYRLPELLSADPADVIFIGEGEKVADRLADAGLTATTNAGGSGKWTPELATWFEGRNVVILPDNDEPGRKHAEAVAASLNGVAASVKVVDLSGLPPKGDAVEWFESGGTADELRRLAKVAPAWEKVSAALKGGVPAERNFVFRTARETAEATPDQPEWLAFGYVAAGAVTEIDGKVKGGKTTLIMALIAAVREGRPFLAKPTKRAAVVFLTEQGPASFRETLRRAALLEADDVHILYWADAQGVPWPDIVAAARLKAQEAGAGLLVVDTLAHWAGLRGDAENSSGAALEAVGPLLAAAADGLGVVVLRHERKSGGDVGDSARGSSAFGGAVDIVVQIRRPEGNGRATLRVLTALSRFDETPGELVVELTEDGEYITHGDGTAVAHAEALAAITKAAPESEAAALTEKDLLATAGTKRTLGQAAIRELLADTKLSRTGEGKKGDPYRYWRAGTTEKVSAALKKEEAAERNGTANEHPESFLPEPPVVAAERNGHHPAAAEFLSAGTSSLYAAERKQVDDEHSEEEIVTWTG